MARRGSGTVTTAQRHSASTAVAVPDAIMTSQSGPASRSKRAAAATALAPQWAARGRVLNKVLRLDLDRYRFH